MNNLCPIPCVLMRGGTSKGPFFIASDLPSNPELRDRLLIAALGAGHHQQIDGIGGGHPVTSKVAIIGPSTRAGVDVDYLFAQVDVDTRAVDTSPNCGNILAGVGPFAIEAGMVTARSGVTPVRIFNSNTGKLIEARVSTPGGHVSYAGKAAIAGVPGTAAPVELAFLEAAGSKTGALLPTGSARDHIAGVEVSCVDAAMPVVMLEAAALGKTGHETPAELEGDRAFMQRLEQLRVEAGARMGIADAAERVIPKPVLLAPPRAGGRFAARYFTPKRCHVSLAVTGSVALATAACTPGTLAAAYTGALELPTSLAIEHPAGLLEVGLERDPNFEHPVALILRTARRLFEGYVLVPAEALEE